MPLNRSCAGGRPRAGREIDSGRCAGTSGGAGFPAASQRGDAREAER